MKPVLSVPPPSVQRVDPLGYCGYKGALDIGARRQFPALEYGAMHIALDVPARFSAGFQWRGCGSAAHESTVCRRHLERLFSIRGCGKLYETQLSSPMWRASLQAGRASRMNRTYGVLCLSLGIT